jgi:hypothetical protein
MKQRHGTRLCQLKLKAIGTSWQRSFARSFFPISKVQHLRRQVITFTQGEEEGIDQAWNRFNELIEQGPRLGFSDDVLLHTFFFSITPSCMQYVQMCVGGDLMEKTLTEAAQLLKKLVKRRPCEEIGKQDSLESQNTIHGWRHVLKFIKRQPQKSQKSSQSRKSLKENTSSQELPRALTSLNQMKQIREVCQVQSH